MVTDFLRKMNASEFASLEKVQCFYCDQKCDQKLVKVSVPECPKIRHVSPPEGCRFTEEKTDDGCPMKQLVCDGKCKF